MEDIAAAYTNIKIVEDKPEVKEQSKGLLSSTKRMNVTDKIDKQEPKDRVQQYVGEIRKKRMELKNV
jgi:hypothetical protein